MRAHRPPMLHVLARANASMTNVSSVKRMAKICMGKTAQECGQERSKLPHIAHPRGNADPDALSCTATLSIWQTMWPTSEGCVLRERSLAINDKRRSRTRTNGGTTRRQQPRRFTTSANNMSCYALKLQRLLCGLLRLYMRKPRHTRTYTAIPHDN